MPLTSNSDEIGIAFLSETRYFRDRTPPAHYGIDRHTDRGPELCYQLAERCLDAARVNQLERFFTFRPGRRS